MIEPETEFIRIAPDVRMGRNVQFFGFVNLYGCDIGDDTRIGTFVEIQKGATLGEVTELLKWEKR